MAFTLNSNEALVSRLPRYSRFRCSSCGLRAVWEVVTLPWITSDEPYYFCTGCFELFKITEAMTQ